MNVACTREAGPRPSSKIVARCFYSGTDAHPMFVEHLPPSRLVPSRPPVVMVHGGGHTGACYLATPDRRPGWAERFAEAGYPVFVPDWPGHGRSPMRVDFPKLGTGDVAASLIALLEEIGPAVLLVHSASGPIAWWIAEQRPDLVAAVVGIAPGPPANLQRDLPDDPAAVFALRNDESAGCPIYAPEDAPVWFNAAFAATYWANAPRFPHAAFGSYCHMIVPESARILNERFNIGGRGLKISAPERLRNHPILIVTGDRDPRHSRDIDESTAKYVGADFIWLPDRGIVGNGHLMMIEENSDEIADVTLAWLASKV